MFRWFETRIDPFAGSGEVRPPDRLGAFYWHFVGQCWPAFLALLAVGFCGAVAEASLFAFVGTIVDRMREAPSPQTFLDDNWQILALMAFLLAIATGMAAETIARRSRRRPRRALTARPAPTGYLGRDDMPVQASGASRRRARRRGL